MREIRTKLWRGVGVAVALGVGVAACAPEAQQSEPASPEAQAAATPAAGGEGEGGEAGEAGAADAYAGIEGAPRTIVRLQHLEGFLILAERLSAEGQSDAAAILAQQGLLEIADPALAEFDGVDLNAVRAAAMGGDPAALAPALRATIAQLDARQKALGGTNADTVRRMLSLTRGLYSVTIVDGAVDPTEYQHSLGAALAAADALEEAAPQARDAKREIDRLLALWPSVTAPERPTPVSEVIAQTSRVELALPR